MPLFGSGGRSESRRAWLCKWAAIVAFAAFQVILFSLAVAAISKANGLQRASRAASNGDCIELTYPVLPNVNIQKGQVVSLAAADTTTGAVQLGAGISVVKHDKRVPLDFSAGQLEVVKMSADTAAAFFTNPTSKFIFLVEGTISIGGDIQWSLVQSTGQQGNSLQAVALSSNLVALVSSQGVFFATRSSPNVWAWQGPFSYASAEAVNSQLCPLTSSSFALSYYDKDDDSQSVLTTSVGIYDSSGSGSVKFQGRLQFPNISTQTTSIACPTNSSYVLSYYTNSTVEAMLIQVSTTGGASTVVARDAVHSVEPTNFFASVALGPSTVVIAFDDARRDYAYLAAVLNVFSFGVIDFGGLAPLSPNAGGAELPNQLWSFIALTALSPNTFVFAYPDVGAGDRIVTVVGGVSKASEVLLLSPSFVYLPVNTRPSEEYLWVAATSLTESSFLVVYALTNDPTQQGIGSAVGVYLPEPLGIATADAADGQVSVAIAGRCTIAGTSLQPGVTYYGDAAGRLRAIPASSRAQSELGYVDLGQEFLTQAYIGHALSETSILLQYKRS